MGSVVRFDPNFRSSEDVLLHNLNSPLMFTAYERPLFYEGRNGGRFKSGSKSLVRMIDDKPAELAVVKETYRMVQNDELFGAIHDGFGRGITREELAGAHVQDRIAHRGAICLREYIFRDIAIDSPDNDKIAFRVIVQNGFGTGAIKIIAGAIDFFCTNGLILGEFSTTYVRHTKGLQIGRVSEAIERSVTMFWKQKDFFAKMKSMQLTDDLRVEAFLKEMFSERLGLKLFRQYLIEKKTRGGNLWALYSALTYYASHNDGEFTLRDTGSDHEAVTMLRRATEVQKVTNDPKFLELTAIAA